MSDIRDTRGDPGYFRRESLDREEDSTNSFGRLIADNTTIKQDLASHYPFNAQRFRLYEDGSRVFPQYGGASSIFSNEIDVRKITPGANQRIKYQTAERFRYVVSHTAEWSGAIQTNRALNDDEEILLILEGIRDSSANNLEPLDYHGIKFTSSGAEVVLSRDGTEVLTESVSPTKTLQDWVRYETRYSYYNVGEHALRQTYTVDGKQQNDLLARYSRDDQRSQRVGNGRITVEIVTGSASDLEVDIGSFAFLILGNVVATGRHKTAVLESLTHSGGGQFEALAAIRVKDDTQFQQVSAELEQINVLSSPGDGIITAQAVDSSKTDASGFSTAPSQTDSTAIEQTTNVSTFPDANGDVVSSADDVGGYQVGATTVDVDGSGPTAQKRQTGRITTAQIYDTDVVVFLAKTSSSGDFRLEYITDQEW